MPAHPIETMHSRQSALPRDLFGFQYVALLVTPSSPPIPQNVVHGDNNPISIIRMLAGSSVSMHWCTSTQIQLLLYS